jgi:hypothetical protein
MSTKLLLFLLIISSSIFAETFVELKDGHLYGGKIVAESKTTIVLKVLAEYLTFEREEILRIYEKANTEDDQWLERARKEREAAKKKEKKIKDEQKQKQSPPKQERQQDAGGQQDRPLPPMPDQLA